MLPIVSEAVEVLFLVSILPITDKYSGILGSFVYHIFTVIFRRIPLFSRILDGPVRLTALFKIPSWTISSSGALLGLLIHNVIWGEPDQTIEFWVIMAIALIAILNILHDLVLFQLTGYDEIVQGLKEIPFITQPFEQQFPNFEQLMQTNKVRLSLSRALFVDMNLTTFLRLIISIGIVFYCISHLRIIVTTAQLPTIWESISFAFLLLNIVDTDRFSQIPFTGQAWNIVYISAGSIIFFWIVIFLALASSTVDQVINDTENIVTNSTFNTNYTYTKHPNFESAPKKRNSIRIIGAVVNPEDQEIGNEKVLIVNTSSKPIDISGWSIQDGNGGRSFFSNENLASGAITSFYPGDTVRFSNRGGSITLLNEKNIVIDTVNYSENDADEEGKTILF